jgi:23S rRNA (uracil1939-C5)-methyltransferase
MAKVPVTGEIIECSLTSLEYGGHACVKYANKILYIPRGVPGDTVKLVIKQLRKNFGSALILDLIYPSPDRVSSICKFFEAGCGGCQWQHIDYRTQLFWKRKILAKILSKTMTTETAVQAVIPMRDPQAFRNKMSLVRDSSGMFGLMKENSKELCVIDHCPMQLPGIQRLHAKLSTFSFPPAVRQLHIRGTRNQYSLVMYVDRFQPALAATAKKLIRSIPQLASIAAKTRTMTKLLEGIPFLSQSVGRLDFRIPPGAFFQTNYFQSLTLLETAKKLLALKGSERVLDLFSGVGFFSLELAREAGQVTGIEANPQAVEAARLNASLNHIGNTDFTAVSALPGLQGLKRGSFDALLLDPPRAGCSEKVLNEIIRLGIPRLVYFSCDAQALARDCSFLVAGGYLLGDIIPVDMFPHTHHLETAVKLVKRGYRSAG